ncbi:hypothetical protein FHX42_000468 [Saccharopolyspora lacisalsi]|uniref:Uncharacterized protein n=1 Tax=Halosaccharopolyspora lacisalsi TaxID=1000566 RepID=A0A839DQX5_9PSEU|nr:hypothetical protein [Halosaccharopolyspora lacisalsi]MBA8823139.1 hypothetical protein [Halosaccharopolyspora lacisalsi]
MDYVVTAAVEPPVQATRLDALQQEGVVSLLDRQLGQIEGVAGPEEESIDVLDYRIAVTSEGANVMLALDAPTLRAAEEAAKTVLNELIAESESLPEWTVARSEVRITEDEFNQSLAAAEDQTDEEPRSEAEAALEAAVEEALEGSEEVEQAESRSWKDELVDLSSRLRAFDLGAFTPGGLDRDEERSRMAAGALVHAVHVVTDELFYDELALTINDATVSEAVGLLVLEELPSCYQHRYDARFTRGLLLASAAVASALTESIWTPPRTVAETLALRLFIDEARMVLEAAELMSWEDSEAVFTALGPFADNEHESLYEIDFPLTTKSLEESEVSPLRIEEVEGELRTRGLAFDQWFQQRRDAATTEGIHPYLR